MKQEIWKEIPNSKYYSVSNYGRVKRLQHQKWCKVNNSFSTFSEKILQVNYSNTKHYGRVSINFTDGTKTICGIHRLVAICFLDNPLNLPQVNHKDGNKANNYMDNLEWCSATENMQHRIHTLDIKPWKKGEESNFVKLTEEQVRQIPDLLKQGMKKCNIAKLFNVKNTTITEITSGRSWKHLNLF